MNNYQPLKPLKISDKESTKIGLEMIEKHSQPLSKRKKDFLQECLDLYNEREDAKKLVYNF
ncbi:hypothetical protein [Priestia endophytica]|uniref:hypothetical protein n=1 Tax=Priestia endophytica TaxID=135735 RepID=UPI00227E025C|nr:hypothetical protein [Priestia endophytica]MCY8235534.1 hypothetical protein [Priestia endophytica]